MSDIISDGTIRVILVPAGPSGITGIVNLAAPTLAEAAAGTIITAQLTDDGLVGWRSVSAMVKNTSLASKNDTERIGRGKASGLMLRFKARTPGSDAIKAALTKGTFWHVMIRYDVDTDTANAAGQLWEVFPVEAGERAQVEKEDNTMSRYEIPFANHITPQLNAVMAA